MRQQTTILTLILAFALPILAAADQKSGQSKPRPPIILSKGYGHGLGNYPKAPDRQSITCTYDGATLEFDFTVSEGISTLTVTDETPQCVTYTIDTSSLYVSVPVGPLSGSISIELDTERGNYFVGTIP